jgi:hypothetical protein
MFRVLIWGECAIILGIAAIAYLLIQNSENLKEKLMSKLIVWSLLLMSLVIFLLSFRNIRGALIRLFL